MIAELVGCLERTRDYIRASVADLTDEEMTLQPAGMPNHPAWTVGHLVYSFQAIAAELGAASWLPDDWERLFGYGSSPTDVAASSCRSKAALLASLDNAVDRLRNTLLAVDESTLRDPLRDATSREVFATTGDAVLQVVAAHAAFHAGQLAAWRRAIGRQPAAVFV